MFDTFFVKIVPSTLCRKFRQNVQNNSRILQLCTCCPISMKDWAFYFLWYERNYFSMTQTANTINVSSDFFSYYRLTVTYRNAWKDLDNWNSNWKSLIPFWVFYSHIHCFDICFYVFGTYTYMYVIWITVKAISNMKLTYHSIKIIDSSSLSLSLMKSFLFNFSMP